VRSIPRGDAELITFARASANGGRHGIAVTSLPWRAQLELGESRNWRKSNWHWSRSNCCGERRLLDTQRICGPSLVWPSSSGRVTGVSYYPSHVWRVLRQMGWSLQRPTLKAKERDEEKITQWKTQTWEEVKKTLASGVHG
jgi:hypothetical protein